MKILKFNEMHNITGQRIKELRIQRGLTQEQLAAKMQTAGIQINQKAISRIESGDRIITDYELMCLTEILRVSINQLLKIPSMILSPTDSSYFVNHSHSSYGFEGCAFLLCVMEIAFFFLTLFHIYLITKITIMPISIARI